MVLSPEIIVTPVNAKKYIGTPAVDLERDEVMFYDDILAAYLHAETSGADLVTEGSRLILKFAKMVSTWRGGRGEIARNGYLLVLALFFHRVEPVDSDGREVLALDPLEKEWLRQELAAVFDYDPFPF